MTPSATQEIFPQGVPKSAHCHLSCIVPPPQPCQKTERNSSRGNDQSVCRRPYATMFGTIPWDRSRKNPTSARHSFNMVQRKFRGAVSRKDDRLSHIKNPKETSGKSKPQFIIDSQEMNYSKDLSILGVKIDSTALHQSRKRSKEKVQKEITNPTLSLQTQMGFESSGSEKSLQSVREAWSSLRDGSMANVFVGQPTESPRSLQQRSSQDNHRSSCRDPSYSMQIGSGVANPFSNITGASSKVILEVYTFRRGLPAQKTGVRET